uniref:BOWMAN_BIRK domain-containing protein n=1 Tax=Globodera pallida TaxID=36090 RepID=A0A183C3L1_GLOPA
MNFFKRKLAAGFLQKQNKFFADDKMRVVFGCVFFCLILAVSLNTFADGSVIIDECTNVCPPRSVQCASQCVKCANVKCKKDCKKPSAPKCLECGKKAAQECKKV